MEDPGPVRLPRRSWQERRAYRCVVNMLVSLHIALMRDERKVLELSQHQAGKPKIQVYTAAGRLIATLSVST